MRGGLRSLVLIATVVACAAGSVPAAASDGAKPPGLEFLGQAIVPTGATFAGTTIGGLSSITYDAERGVFYTLSDDPSQFNPARFYTVRVNVSDGHLDNGDVAFLGVTTLLAPGGAPYPAQSLDPEGMTLAKSGELIVTSEGFATRLIPAWVRRYTLGGTYLGDLPVPSAFEPTGPTHGIRQNLAFEAAAVSPNGRHLFVGMENALVQDGLSEVETTTTERSRPRGPRSCSRKLRTSRPRSPTSARTTTSASVPRAIMPSSVLLPTPLPPNRPTRWPRPQVSIASMARTPVASG